MQKEHKGWTRKIEGNQKLLHNVKNPLRYYLQKQLKMIDLSAYSTRPAQAVNLSIGDPTNSADFRTNPQNLAVISKSVGKIDGYTKFVGCEQARESIANKFKAPNYKISKDNVILTAGGSLAIWAVIMLLGNQGDNFLFPSPGFPLAGVIANSIGLNAKFYHLDPNDQWKANLQQMESLIDERTKFILVNDPSNPLGTCWPEQHKLEIIELARKKNIPLLADQIYEGVTYGEPSRTFAQLATDDVTIFKCSGLTKRWLGPGWRLGWVIVYSNQENYKKYYESLRNIFNIILMPNTVMQASVKQILENPKNEEYLHEKMLKMGKNTELLQQSLKQQDYCVVGHASGALYATILMKMEKFDKKQFANIIQFCKRLYAQENVMIFPGKFFNSEQTFIRLTISCSISSIEEFLKRFKRFCKKYETK